MIVVDSSAHSVVVITPIQDDLNGPALSYWPKSAFFPQAYVQYVQIPQSGPKLEF